jgi:hypothetical protein
MISVHRRSNSHRIRNAYGREPVRTFAGSDREVRVHSPKHLPESLYSLAGPLKQKTTRQSVCCARLSGSQMANFRRGKSGADSGCTVGFSHLLWRIKDGDSRCALQKQNGPTMHVAVVVVAAAVVPATSCAVSC